MEVKFGKRYVDKSGKITGKLTKTFFDAQSRWHDIYPFWDETSSTYYTKDGRVYWDKESEGDLVAEYQESSEVSHGSSDNEAVHRSDSLNKSVFRVEVSFPVMVELPSEASLLFGSAEEYAIRAVMDVLSLEVHRPQKAFIFGRDQLPATVVVDHVNIDLSSTKIHPASGD